MTRVDAHQHYWSLQRGDYAWLTPGAGSLYRDFMPEELSGQLADCAVRATVLVQAAATEDETRFLLGLARRCRPLRDSGIGPAHPALKR